MTVTLTDVTLWVGPGGSLDDNDTPLDVTDATSFSDDTVQAGDLGFSGHVGSLKLVSLKNTNGTPTDATDDMTYLALDISGVNASLVGLEDVLAFNAWDIGVLVNKATDSTPLTPPAKLNWASFTVTSRPRAARLQSGSERQCGSVALGSGLAQRARWAGGAQGRQLRDAAGSGERQRRRRRR